MNKYLILFNQIGNCVLRAIITAYSEDEAEEKLREFVCGDLIVIEKIERLEK